MARKFFNAALLSVLSDISSAGKLFLQYTVQALESFRTQTDGHRAV